MKVKVNQDKCIGCGACSAIAPEVFEISDEGLSQVINEGMEIAEENEDAVRDAVDSCPTSAIEEE